MNQTEFKRAKFAVKGKSEELALSQAVEKLGVPATQLQAAHTETTFIFKVIDNGASTDNGAGTEQLKKQFPFGLHTVERTGADNDLQNAKRAAMEHFNTFEANIKRVESEEDETHFVFTKVRG